MPPRRSPGDLHSRLNATCRWCSRDVMWLTHAVTGDLAPIDPQPTPGGNVLVERTAGGALTGVYSVMNRGERALFDANAGDADATPLLHVNHYVTCGSSTARRLAADRARAKAGAPTVTADGTPMRRPRGVDATVDRLAPPPSIAHAVAVCTVCGGGLHRMLVAAGERRHTFCSWPPADRELVAADVARARADFHRSNPGRLTWGERSEQL